MSPRRRCVGCGRIASKRELVRIALSAETDQRAVRAVVDVDAVMPGRGAYLCRGLDHGRPAEGCLELARRRGGIARALRVPSKLVESINL